MGFFRNLFSDPSTRIDDKIRSELGRWNIQNYTVSEKDFPAYRFVDIFRAIDSKMEGKTNLRTIQSDNYEDLASLIHIEAQFADYRHIVKSVRTAWPTGPDQESFLPVDHYWIYSDQSSAKAGSIIIRLKYRKQEEKTTLEVASSNAGLAVKIVGEIVDESFAVSIYRRQMLGLTFEAGTKDEYGDIEKPERLRINFNVAQPVRKEDFVIDEVVFDTLRRNVIDLHKRRALLRKRGVPLRRGVLLYGPPGTGKTYACRYICGELTETTRIVVAGTALNKVSQIFDLARTYQPSLIILEDVDLVFAARDINLYSSALGDLLDHMDGLRPFEEIGIIMTTNSIERMEAAIRDRPGRISQCIYFGSPEEELRAKYIAQYAKDYDYASADQDELLNMTKGTTPAFIKEWIHRTVQFASERVSDTETDLILKTADFRAAHDEMKRFTDASSVRIIGFIGDRD